MIKWASVFNIQSNVLSPPHGYWAILFLLVYVADHSLFRYFTKYTFWEMTADGLTSEEYQCHDPWVTLLLSSVTQYFIMVGTARINAKRNLDYSSWYIIWSCVLGHQIYWMRSNPAWMLYCLHLGCPKCGPSSRKLQVEVFDTDQRFSYFFMPITTYPIYQHSMTI